MLGGGGRGEPGQEEHPGEGMIKSLVEEMWFVALSFRAQEGIKRKKTAASK